MINFRYHIVSLTAIFLALGVGVLFGAVFVPEQTVRTLETAQERLGQRNEELRGQVEELQESNQELSAFAIASRDRLIQGVLAGRPVLLVSTDLVEEDVLEEAEAALVFSGADVVGSIVLDETLDLATPERRSRLAVALGIQSDSSEELHGGLVARLVETLKGFPGFLADLVSNDLAATRDVADAEVGQPATYPTQGTAVVFIVTSTEEISIVQDTVIRQVLEGLVGGPSTVVLADSGRGGTLLRLVRGELPDGLLTVDSLEAPRGQTALVLGLEAAFHGETGHYGSGPGAEAALPDRPAPSASPTP